MRDPYGQVIIPEAVSQEITGRVADLPGALEIQALEWAEQEVLPVKAGIQDRKGIRVIRQEACT